MEFLPQILEACAALGLFLVGMLVMTEGLESLVGNARARLLSKYTNSAWSGAVVGALTTAVVQSSSATTIAAVGFVGAGLLSFEQALGILFGANLGTTITGWLVALVGFKLDLGSIAGPLLLVGVLLRLGGRRRRAGYGSALAGFALVFLGVALMQDTMAAFAEDLTPAAFPQGTFGGRLLLVGIGILITLVTQSSSAGVATALSALHAGAIDFGQAGAMVIGMDIGTTASAMLAASVGGTQARRTGVAHVVYNLGTGIAAFFLLDVYRWSVERLSPGLLEAESELCLVGFHSAFNGLGVLAVLPFARPFARLIERMVPSRGTTLTSALEPALLRGSPRVGLGAVRATLGGLLTLELVAARRRGGRLRSARREALGAALGETRRFLGQLPIDHDDAPAVADRASLELAIQHLERALARFAEQHRIEAPEGDLARAQAALVELANGALEHGPAFEGEAQELWSGIEAIDDLGRPLLLQRARVGELDSSSAFAQLDELRRLRRLAYQLWRTLHHLEQFDSPGATRPELPEPADGSGN